jgi:hypothetical protein
VSVKEAGCVTAGYENHIPPVILNVVKDLKKVERDAVELAGCWC